LLDCQTLFTRIAEKATHQNIESVSFLSDGSILRIIYCIFISAPAGLREKNK